MNVKTLLIIVPLACAVLVSGGMGRHRRGAGPHIDAHRTAGQVDLFR